MPSRLTIAAFALLLVTTGVASARSAAGDGAADANGAAVAGEARPPSREQQLAAALDAAEARYEETGGRLAAALWRRATGEPGAEAEVPLARRDLLAVFSDPNLVALLQSWRFKRTVTRERSLTRRVDIWVQAHPAAAVELDPGIAAMSDRLLAALANHRYVLDGRETDVDALHAILATSDDEGLRRRAWLALLAPGRTIAADAKALNRMRAVKARDLGAEHYFDLIYAANEMDTRWLKLMLHTVERRTRAANDDLDARMQAALGKPALAPWDIERAMAILARQRGVDVIEERRLPAAGAPAALAGLARMLGIPPSEVEARRARAPIAGTLEEIISLIPGGLMLLTRREPGAPAEGGDGYALFLGAGAAALQASATRAGSPMLEGYDWVPGTRNAIFARARAEIFAGFLSDPAFLRSLGMSKEEIAPFLAQQRDRALIRLRWIGLNMSTEYVMFLNPDADLDQRYRDSFETYMNYRLAPDDPLPWTVEPRFVSRPVSWFADLTALSVAADVHHRMRERFGADPLAAGGVGPWLIETCFADGETVPVQERVSATLKAGFDFRRYLESLGITPVKPVAGP